MAFGGAAVLALFDQVQSHAMRLGLFETVNTHEYKSAPGNGLWCAIWVQNIRPLPAASGLGATSGLVEFRARAGKSFVSKPEDAIDPAVLAAVTTLMGEYSGNFTLGGTVRDVDLLGSSGVALSAVAGYVPIDNRLYRVMDVTLPIVVNDMWTQVP